MRYGVLLEESKEGFAVSVPALPGCHSQGATEQEALENIADAIQSYLTVAQEARNGAMWREVEVELPPKRRQDVAKVVAEMLAWRDREGPILGGISVRELIEEGRR